MTIAGKNRETVFDDLDFSVLTESAGDTQTYTNYGLDGFIGIRPYQRKSQTPDRGNFMYQIEHMQDYIDNSVVMINVDMNQGNSSVIKFGGYD